MSFLLNLFKNLNLCTNYIKQIMNVFSFVQWNKCFHSVKDKMFHSTRLRLVEWNTSSVSPHENYMYHCNHKHSLFVYYFIKLHSVIGVNQYLLLYLCDKSQLISLQTLKNYTPVHWHFVESVENCGLCLRQCLASSNYAHVMHCALATTRANGCDASVKHRAVASLTFPGGQEFHFPQFFLKF